MKIAFMGGNSYQYAFAPSYAQANGKGYITGAQLLGATEVPMTVKQAQEAVAYYKSIGAEDEIPLDVLNLAAQGGSGSQQPLDFISNIINKGAQIVSDITGAKKTTSTSTETAGVPATTTGGKDNTALIVTGAVAGVALLAVAMSGKKRRK